MGKDNEITPKEAHYQAMKGSMERAKLTKKLNRKEKKAFFQMTDNEVDRLEKEIKEPIKKTSNQDVLKDLTKHYKKIKEILQKYVVLEDYYYPLISLWIIGTYLHEQFNTFPLLFINATKGSGKSRLLRLIISLSHSGKLVSDLRESVLFRTAKDNTIGIDEFEMVGHKEMATLRTMLNSAYKKGVGVERMREITKNGKKEWEVERFDLYTSVALANIWGVEEVLADRCVSVVLEKSNDPIRTKLIEDYEENPDILEIKRTLCSLCSVVTVKREDTTWNSYLLNKNNYTNNYTNNTHNTHNTHNNTALTTLYKKIYDSNLNGRDLELFFPLFFIAKFVSDEVLEEVLEITKMIISEKKHEEYTESSDVSLIDFISMKPEYQINYVSIHELVLRFKQFILGGEEEVKWLNSKWMGRALKRLKLISSKRRVTKGVEVTLNVGKAKEKIKIFKTIEEK